MFGPKYIFETRGTRTLRYTRNAFIILFTFFFIYLICGYFFVLFSANENDRSQQRFFKDSPDLIVIFTGQSGRIPYGMKMYLKTQRIETGYKIYQISPWNQGCSRNTFIQSISIRFQHCCRIRSSDTVH